MTGMRFLAGWILAGLLAASAISAQEAIENLPIGAVETAGNVTISRTKILSNVRARAGQPFSEQIAAEDVRRLAGLEGVDTAYYNTRVENGQVILTYVVVEKNLMRSIYLQGNKKLGDSRLLKETGLRQGDYLDRYAVEAAAERLREFYLEKGFPFSSVELDKERLAAGQVIFNITEGPRTKIKDVEFEGNKVLSDRQLQKAVKTKEKKFLFWPVYYNSEQVEKDVDSLKEVYRKWAFLDVQAEANTEFVRERKAAEVTFKIEEGPRYLVDSVSIQGNASIDEAVLREELKLRPDLPFSPDRLEFDRKRILSRYLEKGYLDASVEVRQQFLTGHRVAVEFAITEGSRYRIGEIIIAGNQMVQDNAVRNILNEEGFAPGGWYNGDIARGDGEGELEQVVKQLAVTESTIITPIGTAEGSRDALVQISEGQTGMIMLGAGVASDSGLIGQISLDQRNFDITDFPDSFSELFTGKAFRGAGQRFRAVFSPGTEWSSYLVSFTEPFLYDQPVSMETAFTGFTRLRDSYDEERMGGRINLTKRYRDDWRRGFSFRFENVKVVDLDSDAPSDIVDVKGSNLLFGGRLWIGRDTTDSRFLPSRGYNFDAGYEQVTIDHNFGLLTGTWRWYQTLYEDLAEQKTVLETKLQAGTVVGDAPPFEKFYAGGYGSIRGFEYRGISPRGENGDPIGSDWLVLGIAEVSVPLGNEIFSALFFADAAAIETGTIRTSVGTGVQIMIPQWFGPVPMRFELGLPLTKEDEDDTQAFSFSVGALF